ncbi:bifunctional adenosylcobinamide kinase/adenosylcobinamide-phosphate guanylyltransferase [Microvirga antarctica]|uniref:bifunctional adenosylcobinamide kinase/adenosylcobinamide-phosphate guanylyltransferase n=1 Tax=Microvirga antarctica TaxID=2819233 RepID=UPI001B317012|nr:bifunctional adenosylcobinamide kinase/adenosylcobinamide-phosphate guanylyltransferase [Microvirga antarctica]
MDRYRSALILGGARSGKSRVAQQIAEAASAERVFIATAQAFDDEMRDRIARHQADRDIHWRTREASLDLADAILAEAAPGRAVLVDCLTLWLSNVILAERDPGPETERLVDAVSSAAGPLVLVSNEVGQGIVPATALGRLFRDAQGRLNQRIAETAQAVVLVTAGIPRMVKPTPAFRLDLA